MDVVAIGNAIVDVMARAEDDLLVREGLSKSTMHLINAERAKSLYDAMGPAIEASGGSAGNTAVGIASLGGRAAFIGKVADDTLGRFYRHDMRAVGVHFATAPLVNGAPTARSMILITPDGERTMNTYLGACRKYSIDDLPVDMIQQSRFFYVTGYMWDTRNQKEAVSYALEVAKKYSVKIVFDLADPSAVERHRDDFLHIIEQAADIVFANAQEAYLLLDAHAAGKQDVSEATRFLGALCELAVVKNGEDDTYIYSKGTLTTVPSFKTDVQDTTGAGDNFAAGFLYGLIRGFPIKDCGRIASFVASKTIEKIGAQAPENIREQLASIL